MDAVQKYTDLTYGFLLVLGMTVMFAVQGMTNVAFGFGLGLFVGYAVHVGSQMVTFNYEIRDTVEETKEQVESVTEQVDNVESKVDTVDEKTDEVRDEVNGE